MLPLALVEVFPDLIILLLLCLPLGMLLVRVGEKLVGRSIALTVPERFLLAFYATGSLFFLCASVPFPVYGLPLVAVLLGVGIIGTTALSIRERGLGLRRVVSYLQPWPAIALGLGSLALLGIEVTGGRAPLPHGV